MIAKHIHIFWFGKSEKSDNIKKFNSTLDILKKSGYKIFEWTEDNYDIYKNDFTTFCYNNKKWAHLSDYARLDILFNHGGIYLDQDIEVVRNFDNLLKLNMFIGFMFDCNLGTAVIGSQKKNEHVKNILDLYDTLNISVDSPNNDLFTQYFIDKVDGFKLNGKEQMVDGIKVFPKEIFEQPSFFKKKNYTIHHFENSWREKSKFKRNFQKIVKTIIGLYFYRILMCRKSLKISPFYQEWKKYQ